MKNYKVTDRELLKSSFPILGYFKYDHLPERLQGISKPFADLAYKVAMDFHKTPNSDEIQTGLSLQNLLEAKDCAVRAVGNFK